jgi:hypothetical protein
MHRSVLVPFTLCALTAAGELSFTDVTEQAGLAAAVHGYLVNASTGREMGSGGAVADFNNDGEQDIFFLSGGHTHDSLFLNNGDGTFTDHAAAWGLHDLPPHIGSAALAADFNNDGRPDLYITSHGPAGSNGQVAAHRLFLNLPPNQQGQSRFAELAVHCGVEQTALFATDGIGATVTAKTAAGSQRRHIDAGPTFQTSEERSAHFGLGARTVVSILDIEFHDGTLLRYRNIPANQTLTVTLPPCRADLAEPFGVRDLADIQAFVGYFQSGARAANLADPLPDPHDAPVLDLADLAAFISQFLNCN